MQSKSFSSIICLSLEKGQVFKKKGIKDDRVDLYYWANLPHSCAETQALAQKVIGEVLAEKCWWDIDCSEAHVGLC